MSLNGPGKYKRRKTQARHYHETERAGSAVPEARRKADRRRAAKAAKASRKRNR